MDNSEAAAKATRTAKTLVGSGFRERAHSGPGLLKASEMSEIVKAPTLAEYRTGISLPDAIGLRLSADDGTTYTVRIRRGQIGPLIVEILGQADALSQEGNQRQIEMASLSVTGADAVVDPGGRPGISFRLANGLRLTLALSEAAIENLQHQLAIARQVLRSHSRMAH